MAAPARTPKRRLMVSTMFVALMMISIVSILYLQIRTLFIDFGGVEF